MTSQTVPPSCSEIPGEELSCENITNSSTNRQEKKGYLGSFLHIQGFIYYLVGEWVALCEYITG